MSASKPALRSVAAAVRPAIPAPMIAIAGLRCAIVRPTYEPLAAPKESCVTSQDRCASAGSGRNLSQSSDHGHPADTAWTFSAAKQIAEGDAAAVHRVEGERGDE